MPEQPDLIPLICPSCGGKLEYDKATIADAFVGQADGAFVYIGSASGGEDLTCQHCSNKFAMRSKFQPAPMGNGSVKIQIGGNFTGNMVIGNNNKIGN